MGFVFVYDCRQPASSKISSMSMDQHDSFESCSVVDLWLEAQLSQSETRATSIASDKGRADEPDHNKAVGRKRRSELFETDDT